MPDERRRAAVPALIPSTARSLPMAVSAKGARIFDEAGLDYIDASSGPLAVTLGHGHPRVLAAIAEQFSAVDYVHRTQFRNSAAERLAGLVTERLGGGLDHVMFVSSGSEANEIAMKFAHLYWAAQGREDKHRFVSSSVSYHGNTAGALSASGQPRYAAPYRPLVHAGETITAPQVYRLPVPAGSTAAAECLARLRAEFAGLDLRRTAAILLEGVGGSGSGVLVPPPGFLDELRRLCDASDVLWISDEVMSGFGRTGKWFAFQHSGAVPDIVTFAKGAGGGTLPLGGAALSGKLWERIAAVYPAMTAGHTFTNAPLACAAGIATIEAIEEEGLLARVAGRGAWLGERLRGARGGVPLRRRRPRPRLHVGPRVRRRPGHGGAAGPGARRHRQGDRRRGGQPADRLPGPLLRRRHARRRYPHRPAPHRHRRGTGGAPQPASAPPWSRCPRCSPRLGCRTPATIGPGCRTVRRTVPPTAAPQLR